MIIVTFGEFKCCWSTDVVVIGLTKPQYLWIFYVKTLEPDTIHYSMSVLCIKSFTLNIKADS